jgi:hypothetical protein
LDEKVKYITGSEWARIIAKAWVDPEFCEALECDPINTICNDPDVGVQFDRLITLPPPPSDMSEEKLAQIASGDAPAIVVPFTCITFI